MTRFVAMSRAPSLNNFDHLVDKVVYYREAMRTGGLNKNDIVVFGGGTDVNPMFYGQYRGWYTDKPDVFRDYEEKEAFLEAQKVGAACFGVCRGSQFLTIMNGGKLFQHVEGHANGNHNIETEDKQIIEVTSTHHQMMNPFDLDPNLFKIIGWAEHPLSGGVYLEGVSIKDPVRRKDGKGDDRYLLSRIRPKKEPEIVFYPKTRCLAVQGHPEYVHAAHPFAVLVSNLIKEYLK